MHFSIPDTKELYDGNGSAFTTYNVHINGEFHCSVRYKQLHSLHEQLKKEFGSEKMPYFPPKKLLPLTATQLEERRSMLEKYIHAVGQDSQLSSSELFTAFLLSAQQETTSEKKQEMNLEVYTMNNYKIPLLVLTTDRTEQVLYKACKQINLPTDLIRYFSLYLIKKDNNSELTIIRKLQDFESPYISLKTVQEANRIVIRKSYWDKTFDSELMTDPVALNLLYIQIASDVDLGWIFCPNTVHRQLDALQAKLAKREYIELARTLKYYGYIQFHPCYCDYPEPQTKVLISIGENELNMRLTGPVIKEGSFKVTRMRCWRITATHNNCDVAENSKGNFNATLELSFEYLMSKDVLKWVTITSTQAILMSVLLQSMVDELLTKRDGAKHDRRGSGSKRRPLCYMRRDGSSQLISLDDPDVQNSEDAEMCQDDAFSIQKLKENFSSVSFKSGKEFVENHAFEGIGDDDL